MRSAASARSRSRSTATTSGSTSESSSGSSPGPCASLPDPVSDPKCVFCRIIAGDESAEIVLDEPHAVAFLDFRPVFHGHALLVPRDHHETLLDLPDEAIGPFFATLKRLTAAVTEGMEAQGTFVAMNNIVSQSVPHLHAHVVPRRRKDGLRGFFWPRLRYRDDAEMAALAATIGERLRPRSA